MEFGVTRSGRPYVTLDGRRTYVLDTRNSGQPSRRFKALVRTGRVTSISDSLPFVINPRTGYLIARRRAYTPRGVPRAWFRRATETATGATTDQAFGRSYREERVPLSPPVRAPEITAEMFERVVRERGALESFKAVLGTSAARVYFSAKGDVVRSEELKLNEFLFGFGGELVTGPDDLEALLTRYIQAVAGQAEANYKMRIVRLMSVSMHIALINPLRGSSWAPVPPVVAKSKGVINIKNDDQLCFLYSVAASLMLQEGFTNNDLQRVSHYTERAGELDVGPKWFGVDSISCTFRNRAWRLETSGGEQHGMDLHSADIRAFEERNQVNVNVYGWEDAGLVPARISKAGFERTVQLFSHDGHFSVVRSLSRLCGHRNYVCPRCLSPFVKESAYESHVGACDGTSAQRAVMPPPGNIQFNQHKAMQRLPVAVYWDTESSIDPVTKAHRCISWRFRIVSDIPLRTPLDHVYVGSDAARQLMMKAVELERALTWEINEAKARHAVPRLTAAQEADFACAETCWICKEALGDDGVRDHCHFTGQYRGAAHNECNLSVRCSPNMDIAVLAHNS